MLYAHFEEEQGGDQKLIDRDRLKDILTYKENKVPRCYYKENSLSEIQLRDFLNRFKFIFGEKFEDQQGEVIKKLMNQFNCSEFEADTFYYNNALRIVVDISILPEILERKITRSQFISRINNSKKQLTNEWYIKLRSKGKFLKKAAKAITNTQASLPSKSKNIYIGSEILSADNTELPITAFLHGIVTKYYKMGMAFSNAKPPSIILETDKKNLLRIKKVLINDGVVFNDGYEEIQFHSPAFNKVPVINLNKTRSKLADSSYSMKLISSDTFKNNINAIDKPKVVIHCAKTVCLYERSDDYQLFDIKHCENLSDVYSLLK